MTSKVLIVEDEPMVADMIKETLVEAGYEICGVARTVAEGIALARLHEPELAVIDMQLADGGLGTDIVAQLSDPGRLGVLYATGNVSKVMRIATGGHACLAKPYRDIDLIRGLEIVAEIVATGVASSPFPRGFRLLPLADTARSGFPVS